MNAVLATAAVLAAAAGLFALLAVQPWGIAALWAGAGFGCARVIRDWRAAR